MYVVVPVNINYLTEDISCVSLNFDVRYVERFRDMSGDFQLLFNINRTFSAIFKYSWFDVSLEVRSMF